MEAFISSMIALGPLAKRPPHILLLMSAPWNQADDRRARKDNFETAPVPPCTLGRNRGPCGGGEWLVRPIREGRRRQGTGFSRVRLVPNSRNASGASCPRRGGGS